MLKRNRKFTLLLSGLSGALLATSIAGAALASCTTTTTNDTTTDVQYSYVIDWNNQAQVERLNIDDTGLVYSDSSRTTIIAVSPRVNLATVTIPSTVKSIMGYSKVMYKASNGSGLVESIPSSPATGVTYTKVYQSIGAFQGMESLTSITLQTGSQLQAIGGLAFANCTNLKTISGLSSTLTLIGTQAFQNCSSLTSIDTSNVLKFGNYAFQNCSSLDKVNLTNTIYVGQNTFENCSSLVSIGSVENLRSIGQSAFSNAISSSAQLTLKFSNLLSVSNSAFQSANGLSTLDFSGNTMLTSVGSNAFSGTSVTTVDFTGCSNLQTISTAAFENCKNLTTVNIPAENASSLVSIGNSAFSSATSLTTVASKGSTGFVATSNLNSIGSLAFANTAITSVNLASTKITSFADNTYPLANIPNLTTISLPSTLTTLPAGMFYGSGLNSETGFSLTLSSAVTSLVISSATLTIGSTTTETNVSPFTNSGLATIDLSNVTSYQTTVNQTLVLPDYLFNGLTKLTSVTLKTGTTSIGTYAFASTSALTSITYPSTSEETPTADTTSGFTANSSLTTISTDAFKGAFSATSNATVDLTAMSNVTTAPDAFDESNIQNLKLPTSVTTIAQDSFQSMTKLTTVNFSELTKLTTINNNSFTDANSLVSINLSNSTSLARLDAATSIFTNLATGATVQLPSQVTSTLNSSSFTVATTDGTESTTQASFSYPSGISLNGITNDAATLGSSSYQNPMLQKASGSLDLSSSITSSQSIRWIKSYTFFGNTTLTSLTLPARNVNTNSSGNYGAQAKYFDCDASVNSSTSTANLYAYDKIPFGNNDLLSNMIFNSFTQNTTSSLEDSNTANINPLSKTTSQTWAQVSTFINKFASNDTTTPTAWPTSITGTDTTSSINNDSVITFTQPTNENAQYTLAITNTKVGEGTVESNNFSFSSTMTDSNNTATPTITYTFIHNGVTWTLTVNSLTSTTNPGQVTLVGTNINIYKATTSDNNLSYQIPFKLSTTSKASTGITVTLNILDAVTTSTK